MSAVKRDLVLDGLLDAFEGGVFLLDGDGRVANANETARILADGDDVTDTELTELGVCDEELLAEMRRGDAEVTRDRQEVRIDGETRVVNQRARPIRGDDGSLAGSVVAVRDVTEEVRRERREGAIESYQGLVLGHRQEELDRVADGDLTVEPALPDPEEDFEEMQTAYEAFRKTKENLEGAITNLRDLVELIQHQSHNLVEKDAALTEVNRTVSGQIDEIHEACERINEDTDTLVVRTDEAQNSLADFTATIEEISATAQQIDDLSGRTAEFTAEGTGTASTAVDRIETAVEATEEISEKVSALAENMKDVEEITGVITDLAEQTNMLALNANIEAARSGQDGEGFAVVANEIKNLAEDSHSADEIVAIVEQLQAQTSVVTSEIDDLAADIEQASDAVTDVVDVLEEIRTKAEETSNGVSEVSDAVETQSTNADELHALVEDVSAVSEQVDRSTKEITDGVKEQSEAVRRVEDISTEISQAATDLETAVEEFTLEEGGQQPTT